MSTCDSRTNSIPVRFVCFASMIVAECSYISWTDTVDAGHTFQIQKTKQGIKNSFVASVQSWLKVTKYYRLFIAPYRTLASATTTYPRQNGLHTTYECTSFYCTFDPKLTRNRILPSPNSTPSNPKPHKNTPNRPFHLPPNRLPRPLLHPTALGSPYFLNPRPRLRSPPRRDPAPLVEDS